MAKPGRFVQAVAAVLCMYVNPSLSSVSSTCYSSATQYVRDVLLLRGLYSTLGFPVLHYLQEFAQTHVYWVSDAIQPSHPLSSPSPPALNLSQHQGLFQWVSSSHQVIKVLELQLPHQSFQWIFRVDFLWDWLVWSPCCPRDSQESYSPAPHFKSISSLAISLPYGPSGPSKRAPCPKLSSSLSFLVSQHPPRNTVVNWPSMCLISARALFCSTEIYPEKCVSVNLGGRLNIKH